MNKLNLFQRLIMRVMGKSLVDLYPRVTQYQTVMVSNNNDNEASYNSVVSFQQGAAFYNNYMWLQKAISILANNIAPLPVRVCTGKGKDKKYLDSHAAYVLLDNPNPSTSPEDLWKQWVTDMLCGGEMGLELSRNKGRGKVLELWPRQSDVITVILENRRYSKVGGYKIDDNNGDPYLLPPQDFIFWKFYNPQNIFRGISPVTAIRLSITIDELAQSWSHLFFKNQTRPDFAIITPQGITEPEKTEMYKRFDEWATSSRLHKPMILEEGITDIKPINYPAKDTEWLNQREMARDEVAAIVGVPDEMMGFGKNTYENFDTADRVMWTSTIVPLAGLRDGGLTAGLRRAGLLKPNERIETDTSDVPQLQEDKTGKIDQLIKLADKGYPVNRVNEWLGLGLPKVTGGDVGYISAILVPMGTTRPEPAPATPPTSGSAQEESQPPEEPPAKAYKRKDWHVYGSVEHMEAYQKAQARLDSHVLDMQKIAKREFQRQQNEINAKLRGKKAEKLPTPEELFDMEEEIRRFIASFKDVVFRAVEKVGQAELTGLGVGGIFNLERPEVQRAIATILKAVSTKTNDTTYQDLTGILTQAEKDGVGITETMKRMSDYWDGQKDADGNRISEGRKGNYSTERIARTTMTGAGNLGSKEAWIQSEVVEKKSWLSALIPNRTREAHAAAHGQEVGLNEPFIVDGEELDYPGDPSGSPGNTIQCLCNMLAVLKE
jgi:HK97 family phage portal protein